MTLVRVYLVVYYLVFFGALFALWQSGVLSQLPGVWVALVCVAAIGLGLLLALASTTTARKVSD
jgi:hypothetical protein